MDNFFVSNPVIKSFLAGSLSGTCSILLFQPFDLVKTRLQVSASVTLPNMSPKNIFNIVRTVVQTESIFGLWKGSWPSFYRVAPGVGMYFSSLHFLKTTFFEDQQPKGYESLLLGCTARTLASLCTLPMTVVKTRFESGKFEYRTISEAFFNIHKKEGAGGLFRGVSATLLRDAPFSGLYLMMYTSTKGLVVDGGAMYNFICGIFSGAVASLISQPADVIKTKMQVSQSKLRILEVVSQTYKEEGVAGYFRGLTPRIARRTLMAAMAWSVYEQISKLLKL